MEWSGEDRKKIESFYPSTYGETISSLTREIFPNPQEAEIESARRLEKLRTYLKTLDDKQSEDKNQKFAKYGRLAQYFFLPQINDEYKHLKKQQKQLGVPEK